MVSSQFNVSFVFSRVPVSSLPLTSCCKLTTRTSFGRICSVSVNIRTMKGAGSRNGNQNSAPRKIGSALNSNQPSSSNSSSLSMMTNPTKAMAYKPGLPSALKSPISSSSSLKIYNTTKTTQQNVFQSQAVNTNVPSKNKSSTLSEADFIKKRNAVIETKTEHVEIRGTNTSLDGHSGLAIDFVVNKSNSFLNGFRLFRAFTGSSFVKINNQIHRNETLMLGGPNLDGLRRTQNFGPLEIIWKWVSHSCLHINTPEARNVLALGDKSINKDITLWLKGSSLGISTESLKNFPPLRRRVLYELARFVQDFNK